MDGMHCDIVKDLLPLYVDDVCSEKSREMIEKHLEECEECRQYHESLGKKSPKIVLDTSSDLLEGEFIQKIEKVIHRKITFNMVIAAFITFLVLAIASTMILPYPYQPGFGLYGLVDQRAEKEILKVENVYQLENGKIYFEALSTEAITWPHIDSPQYNPLKKNWYGMAHYEIEWKERYFGGKGNGTAFWFLFNPNEEDDIGNSMELSEFYFECKDDEKIEVWKRGQQIEKAPKEVEEKIANEEGAAWSTFCMRLEK